MQDQNYYRVSNPRTLMLLFDFYGKLPDLMALIYEHVDLTGDNVVSIVKYTCSKPLVCGFENGSVNND